MQYWALGIEYLGADFSGWQRQKHDSRTVQEELEKALSTVANAPINVVCAGRTDTGVHATSQVVNLVSDAKRNERAWLLGGNANLPDDISITWVASVDEDFNARHSALYRRYRYVVMSRPARAAILKQRVTWSRTEYNIGAMQEAAQSLIGELDFSSFRSSICQATHARRNMQEITVSQSGDYIYFDVQANAFLHHMVRNIVGSLLEVGRGAKPISWIASVLAAKDRTIAGPTALADGLYLVEVAYPERYNLPSKRCLPQF